MLKAWALNWSIICCKICNGGGPSMHIMCSRTHPLLVKKQKQVASEVSTSIFPAFRKPTHESAHFLVFSLIFSTWGINFSSVNGSPKTGLAWVLSCMGLSLTRRRGFCVSAGCLGLQGPAGCLVAFPVLFLALNRAIIHSVALTALFTVFFAANFARIRHFYGNILRAKQGCSASRQRRRQSISRPFFPVPHWLSATVSVRTDSLYVRSSWRFFGAIFVSVRIYGRAWEQTRKRWGREARGSRRKPPVSCLHSTFPSPIAFWFNFGSAFARLYLSLNEPQKEKITPKNKPPATQATRKGKSVYGKRQLEATDHYFP